jgi:regulatory protein
VPPEGRSEPHAFADREEERAVALAYRMVSARERTEAEVRTGLERAGVPAPAADAAVSELTRGGYLDDASYAERFNEDKRSLEGWGRERIAQALGRRGVAGELVEAALAASDAEDQFSRARRELASRYRGVLSDDRERGRALRMLVAKGYEVELAYDAVRAHRPE